MAQNKWMYVGILAVALISLLSLSTPVLAGDPWTDPNTNPPGFAGDPWTDLQGDPWTDTDAVLWPDAGLTGDPWTD